ncbi:MAG: flagellar hook-length control protein FliK [Sandaracinus sp.]|nr:flagellar hook-length control protein FliK [Sandaracinus sp.]
MKIDARRPAPPAAVPKRRDEERGAFEAMVGALTRAERPLPRGEVRRGHDEPRKEADMAAERPDDDREIEPEAEPRRSELREVEPEGIEPTLRRWLERPRSSERTRPPEEDTSIEGASSTPNVSGASSTSPEAMPPETMPLETMPPETMPPEVAAFVRFATDLPQGPPPLPWSKARGAWASSGRPSDGSAVVVPNEVETPRPRVACPPPLPREHRAAVAEPRANVADVSNASPVTNATVLPEAAAENLAVESVGLGVSLRSDEVWVASALEAAASRRTPRPYDAAVEAPPFVLGELAPKLAQTFTAALDVGSPEPNAGEALARASSRFVNEDSSIRITHPELGRVRLQLSVDAEHLDVRAVAESALAARLLAESEETLRREIAKHGVELRRLKVRVDDERATTPPPKARDEGPAPTHRPRTTRA